MKVPRAHFAGWNVVHALEAQNVALQRDKAAPLPKALPVHSSGDMQEVQVRRFVRRRKARHHESSPQKWKVEAFSIERHDQRRGSYAIAYALKHGRFFARRSHEQLFEHQRARPVPPGEPHQERHGSGTGQARRLGIKEQGATQAALGESRVEGEKGEQLGACVESGRDGNASGAMTRLKPAHPNVQQTARCLDRGKGEFFGVDSRQAARRRPRFGALEGGLNPGPQILENA
jgi:hypothetical protein